MFALFSSSLKSISLSWFSCKFWLAIWWNAGSGHVLNWSSVLIYLLYAEFELSIWSNFLLFNKFYWSRAGLLILLNYWFSDYFLCFYYFCSELSPRSRLNLFMPRLALLDLKLVLPPQFSSWATSASALSFVQKLQRSEYASRSRNDKYSYFSVATLSSLICCHFLETNFIIYFADSLVPSELNLISFLCSWLKNTKGESGFRGAFFLSLSIYFSFSRSIYQSFWYFWSSSHLLGLRNVSVRLFWACNINMCVFSLK